MRCTIAGEDLYQGIKMSDSTRPITALLDEARNGRTSAQDQLWSAIYGALKTLAHGQMGGESPGHALQTTALVHEAYLRLIGNEDVRWDNRRHFFGAAAEAMRRIRIDEARRRKSLKRGGDRARVDIDEAAAVFDDDPAELLRIDEALRKLEEIDARQAEIVKLRYFGGLSIDDTAKALDVSPRTVDTDWRFARVWLRRELKTDVAPDGGQR